MNKKPIINPNSLPKILKLNGQILNTTSFRMGTSPLANQIILKKVPLSQLNSPSQLSNFIQSLQLSNQTLVNKKVSIKEYDFNRVIFYLKSFRKIMNTQSKMYQSLKFQKLKTRQSTRGNQINKENAIIKNNGNKEHINIKDSYNKDIIINNQVNKDNFQILKQSLILNKQIHIQPIKLIKLKKIQIRSNNLSQNQSKIQHYVEINNNQNDNKQTELAESKLINKDKLNDSVQQVQQTQIIQKRQSVKQVPKSLFRQTLQKESYPIAQYPSQPLSSIRSPLSQTIQLQQRITHLTTSISQLIIKNTSLAQSISQLQQQNYSLQQLIQQKDNSLKELGRKNKESKKGEKEQQVFRYQTAQRFYQLTRNDLSMELEVLQHKLQQREHQLMSLYQIINLQNNKYPNYQIPLLATM